MFELAHKRLLAISLPEPAVVFSPRPVSELDATTTKLQKVYKSYWTGQKLKIVMISNFIVGMELFMDLCRGSCIRLSIMFIRQFRTIPLILKLVFTWVALVILVIIHCS